MKTLKRKIKELSETQRYLKDQRKTDKIVGERKMQPWEATMQHWSNRETLRIMYAAYGVARGKSFSQIENHYPEEGHPLNYYKTQIDKIIAGLHYETTVRPTE
jgi:hypothetical protein